MKALLTRAYELATADRTVSFGEAKEALMGPGVRLAHEQNRIIAVVTIGVVALVGALVFGEVYNETHDAIADTELEDEGENLAEGFASALGFVPIVLIVLLASLVVMIVSRMS